MVWGRPSWSAPCHVLGGTLHRKAVMANGIIMAVWYFFFGDKNKGTTEEWLETFYRQNGWIPQSMAEKWEMVDGKAVLRQPKQ